MLKDILLEKNCSLVVSDGYISYDSGIKPLIDLLSVDLYYFKDKGVADKIIGKASAMLLALSGCKKVYGHIMSKSAKDILEKYDIEYEYHELCEYIINRKKDAMCPMEMLVKDIDDPNIAYQELKKKITQH